MLETMRRRERKRKKGEEKERRKHISSREKDAIFIVFESVLAGIKSATFKKERIREDESIRQEEGEKRDPARPKKSMAKEAE